MSLLIPMCLGVSVVITAALRVARTRSLDRAASRADVLRRLFAPTGGR